MRSSELEENPYCWRNQWCNGAGSSSWVRFYPPRSVERVEMSALGRRGQLRGGAECGPWAGERANLAVQEDRAFDSQVGWGHVKESRKSNRI